MFKYFVLITLMFLNCSAPVEGNPAILAAINEAIQLKIPLYIKGIERITRVDRYDINDNNLMLSQEFKITSDAIIFTNHDMFFGSQIILPINRIQAATFEFSNKILYEGKYIKEEDYEKLSQSQQNSFSNGAWRNWRTERQKTILTLYLDLNIK